MHQGYCIWFHSIDHSTHNLLSKCTFTICAAPAPVCYSEWSWLNYKHRKAIVLYDLRIYAIHINEAWRFLNPVKQQFIEYLSYADWHTLCILRAFKVTFTVTWSWMIKDFWINVILQLCWSGRENGNCFNFICFQFQALIYFINQNHIMFKVCKVYSVDFSLSSVKMNFGNSKLPGTHIIFITLAIYIIC